VTKIYVVHRARRRRFVLSLLIDTSVASLAVGTEIVKPLMNILMLQLRHLPSSMSCQGSSKRMHLLRVLLGLQVGFVFRDIMTLRSDDVTLWKRNKRNDPPISSIFSTRGRWRQAPSRLRPRRVFVEPKFTNFHSPNVAGIVVDEVFFRCSICR